MQRCPHTGIDCPVSANATASSMVRRRRTHLRRSDCNVGRFGSKVVFQWRAATGSVPRCRFRDGSDRLVRIDSTNYETEDSPRDDMTRDAHRSGVVDHRPRPATLRLHDSGRAPRPAPDRAVGHRPISLGFRGPKAQGRRNREAVSGLVLIHHTDVLLLRRRRGRGNGKSRN